MNTKTSNKMFHDHTGTVGWKNNHRLNGLTVLPRVGAPLLLLTFTELSRARGPASSWTHIRFSSSHTGLQRPFNFLPLSSPLTIRRRLIGFLMTDL